MMPAPAFQYDASQQAYSTRWGDCLLTGKMPLRDARKDLYVDMYAHSPDGELLHFKRLRLLDTWACERFAEMVTDKDELRIKVQQYLTKFAELLVDAMATHAHDHAGESPTPAHPLILSMDTVTAQPIEWLWYPYIAIGKLCILDGDPGIGKTMAATQLAANVSRGYPLPAQDGRMTLSCGPPGITIYVATEDDLADTLRPRLDRAHADCSKVKVFNDFVDANDEIQAFTLQHIEQLERCLQEYHPRLVYIDAIQAVLGAKVDANAANQMKALLDPLAKLASTYRCAILASRHPAKPGQNTAAKLIHRGSNSMAIIGTARLALFAEQHPVDPTKVLLIQSKSNAGTIGRTQIFSKKDGVFEWCGVTRIDKDMMAGSGRGPDPRVFVEACFWLEGRLQGAGPYMAFPVHRRNFVR